MTRPPPISTLCPYTSLFRSVMEHIEEAGIHSGDSACALPPITLGTRDIRRIRESTLAIARGVGVRGLLNVQYARSEEHTSELQSRQYLVCRLLLEKTTPTQALFPAPLVCTRIGVFVSTPDAYARGLNANTPTCLIPSAF